MFTKLDQHSILHIKLQCTTIWGLWFACTTWTSYEVLHPAICFNSVATVASELHREKVLGWFSVLLHPPYWRYHVSLDKQIRSRRRSTRAQAPLKPCSGASAVSMQRGPCLRQTYILECCVFTIAHNSTVCTQFEMLFQIKQHNVYKLLAQVVFLCTYCTLKARNKIAGEQYYPHLPVKAW